MQHFRLQQQSSTLAENGGNNEEGSSVEIGDEVRMRLTVGEWIASWLCREEGVQFPKKRNLEDEGDRYVIQYVLFF